MSRNLMSRQPPPIMPTIRQLSCRGIPPPLSSHGGAKAWLGSQPAMVLIFVAAAIPAPIGRLGRIFPSDAIAAEPAAVGSPSKLSITNRRNR